MNQTNLSELVAELVKETGDDSLVSEEFRQLMEAGLHHVHFPPTAHPAPAEAFQRAFEGMGGLSRLLLWADKHPASFYKLYARMLIPTIQPILPLPATQKEEWPEWLTARRLAYQESGFIPTSPDDPDAMDSIEEG
jgi:hypothetical protein